MYDGFTTSALDLTTPTIAVGVPRARDQMAVGEPDPARDMVGGSHPRKCVRPNFMTKSPPTIGRAAVTPTGAQAAGIPTVPGFYMGGGTAAEAPGRHRQGRGSG